MILVTGATGFVGSTVVHHLLEDKHAALVAVAVRRTGVDWGSTVKEHLVADLTATTDWSAALVDVTEVVHCAARVHVMEEQATDPLSEFRAVNVAGTLNLVRQAAAAGVRRFVFLSSIKVNGESTQLGHPFRPDDRSAPLDPYGISKLEAEQGLFVIAKQTGMEVVCIRPPLVYGSGVKANFYSMMKWANKGIPLPFGAIHNKRSLVALDNLVDLILTCIDHPAAANQVFLVSDGVDLSITELLSRVAIALGKKPRLLPINQQLIEFFLKLVGKKELAQRLCASLQVDISKTKKLLNWTPPVSVDEALTKTVEYFLRTKS